MSETSLKIEIRQIVKNSQNADKKAINSIIRVLRMRHIDIDKDFAKDVTIAIIDEINNNKRSV